MKDLGLRQILTTLTFIAIILAVSAVAPIAQSQPQNVSNLLLDYYPDSYTVNDSDTLWNIASQFLQNPERWPDLWQPDEFLDNADLIYPGDVLKIGIVGGTPPRILVQRGGRDVTRLGPRMREEILSSAIPAIPSEAVANSFTRSRIVDRSLFEAAPYIVANLGDSLTIGTGDEVYARGNWPSGTRTFEVYRGTNLYG